MPNDKEMKRLEELLDIFDSGAVQPEELSQAIDVVVQIIKKTQDVLNKKITDNTDKLEGELKNVTIGVIEANNSIQRMVQESEKVSKEEITKVRDLITSEAKRIESNIPALPNEFDATEIFNMLNGQRDSLDGLSLLITGENIRNALEALPTEDDKLKIEAIGNLRKELDELAKSITQSNQRSGAIIARRLDQIGDVNTSGVTNGQYLKYDGVTKTWTPDTMTLADVASTFETVSKNLDSVGATLNYTGTDLTSIVYTNGITKTFNYTGTDLTSIVLSGTTPAGISLTKTLTYSGSDLTGILYS